MAAYDLVEKMPDGRLVVDVIWFKVGFPRASKSFVNSLLTSPIRIVRPGSTRIVGES